jgi:putative transposase
VERASQRRPSPRALLPEEKADVLAVLHDPRFVDKAPAEVYAARLDEGHYDCSIRTMYRILEEADEVRERRNQVRHPHYVRPELLATAPNQVWSWDITKLRGPEKWRYYHLYVVLDIFSRYVVSWLVAERETSVLAQLLLDHAINAQRIRPGQLTVHADRGTAASSRPVAYLLADLGVTRTHSRPQNSNDNPYSEAQFKTLKYRPDFPDRFGSLEDAQDFCRCFFQWYNHEHYHSGLALLTPATVHFGRTEEVIRKRALVLQTAYAGHPERFVHGVPTPASPPAAAWINRPASPEKEAQMLP